MNRSAITMYAEGSEYRLPRFQGIVYAVAFIVEFILTIVGNSVVVLVFEKTKALRKRKSHWLLINLAIIDLSVGAITGPFWLYFLASRCDLWKYEYDIYELIAEDSIFLFSLCASLVNLAVISLERMYATLWPFKHRLLGARDYRAMIGVGWSVPLFLPGFSIAERYKQISLDLFNYIWLTSFCLVILIIVLSYGSIWAKLRLYKDPQNLRVTTICERKLTSSLFIVTAASLLTALPGVVFSVIVFLPPLDRVLSSYSSLHILNSAALLIYASPMINSIIYTFKLPKFRKAALRLVRGSSSRMRVSKVQAINVSLKKAYTVPGISDSVETKERQSETRV